MEQEIKYQIQKRKAEKNAVILAHYYTPPEVQEIADFVGDSFYLAKIAKTCGADILVFCGVSFMGESAKILNPNKKVLMPDLTADCPMAHMVAPGKIEEIRSRYEDVAVVCYINSSAELKAQSDVCVTSSNAVKIVRALPNKTVFFIPDRNLGRYVAQQVPEKQILLNEGFCPVHTAISPSRLEEEKKRHPAAAVLSHPECEDGILCNSDFIGSTAEIIDFAKESPLEEFIICTEDGVNFRLETDNPNKRFFFPAPSPCCPDMKLNTPENILSVLETEKNEVTVGEELCKKARIPLDRMLELAK